MSDIEFSTKELKQPLSKDTLEKMQKLGLPSDISISRQYQKNELKYWYITSIQHKTFVWELSYKNHKWQLTFLNGQRDYLTSPLPTMNKKEEKILEVLYGEINNNWRQLVDVRFKLLGLVPVVSATILISLFNYGNDNKLSPLAKTCIALFGFIITYALQVYDKRNTELYNDLISRAKKIEEELGIETGQFLGRLKSKNSIQHDIALKFIYTTCFLSWLVAILYIIIKSFIVQYI